MKATNELVLLDEKRKDVYLLDPRTFQVDEEFNKRKNYGDIESLARSISKRWSGSSVLSGYRGENGVIMIVDGFRRNRAIQMAIVNGWIDIDSWVSEDDLGKAKPTIGFRVPVMLKNKNEYSMKMRYLDMYQSQDNKQLEPEEKCELFYSLVNEHGMTVEEIAQSIGQSTAHVSQMLSIANAPEELRDAVYSGQMQTSAALDILSDAKKEAKEKSKHNGAPANEIKNTAVREKTEKAIAQAKKDGKTVVTKKQVTAAKKKESNVEAPKGMLKMMDEILDLMQSQKRTPNAADFMENLIELMRDRKMTYAEFIDICETIEAAPVLK